MRWRRWWDWRLGTANEQQLPSRIIAWRVWKERRRALALLFWFVSSARELQLGGAGGALELGEAPWLHPSFATAQLRSLGSSCQSLRMEKTSKESQSRDKISSGLNHPKLRHHHGQPCRVVNRVRATLDDLVSLPPSQLSLDAVSFVPILKS